MMTPQIRNETLPQSLVYEYESQFSISNAVYGAAFPRKWETNLRLASRRKMPRAIYRENGTRHDVLREYLARIICEWSSERGGGRGGVGGRGLSHINLSTFVNGSGNLLIHLFNNKVAQEQGKWREGQAVNGASRWRTAKGQRHQRLSKRGQCAGAGVCDWHM